MSEKVYGICGTNKSRKEVIPKENVIEVLFPSTKITSSSLIQRFDGLASGISKNDHVIAIMVKSPSSDNYWDLYPKIDSNYALNASVGNNIVFLYGKLTDTTSGLTSVTLDVKVIIGKL